MSSKEKKEVGPHIRSEISYSTLSNIDFLGYLQTSTKMVNGKRGFESMINNEYEHYTQVCGPCVGASENQNLSNTQKELFLWHFKWGISIHRTQEMMKPQQVVDPDGTRSIVDSVISPKLATAANFAVTACESCLLGRSKKRSPDVAKVKHVPDKEGILARHKYEVGYFVSTDQSDVRTTGRLPTGYGRKRRQNLFHGGTIYNYVVSGLIWVENQVLLGSNETVLG